VDLYHLPLEPGLIMRLYPKNNTNFDKKKNSNFVVTNNIRLILYTPNYYFEVDILFLYLLMTSDIQPSLLTNMLLLYYNLYYNNSYITHKYIYIYCCIHVALFNSRYLPHLIQKQNYLI